MIVMRSLQVMSAVSLVISVYYASIGIADGFLRTAFTGAVIGGKGAVSYALIIAVFSLITLLFTTMLIQDKKRGHV